MGRLLIQPVRILVIKNAFQVIRARLHRDPSGPPILQGGLLGGVNARFSDVCKLRETGLTGFTAMGSSWIQGIDPHLRNNDHLLCRIHTGCNGPVQHLLIIDLALC